MGFTRPRPIQTRAIPETLRGRDVLGLAQTGTGKTAAFALPILQRILESKASGRRGPRALIVAPTRELAAQIQAEFEQLAQFTNARITTVFGGVGAGKQVAALKKLPDVVVACPGRLLDLMGQRAVDLSDVEVLVLDEADHMFDMGFLPDVRRILKALPRKRQNLLFSATMPKEIRGLADQVLERPLVVELEHSRPADTVAHALYPVAQTRKVELLQRLLRGEDFESAIVFLRTKHRARKLAKQLAGMGHRAIALQGNMSQGQRERAMKGFREGHYDVLVATDIAARGIDVAGISHVVNFDVPNTTDAYTHRIGRTGRAELTGKACTFVTSEDAEFVRAVERRLQMTIERRVEPGFEGERIDGNGSGGRGGRKTRFGKDALDRSDRSGGGRGTNGRRNRRSGERSGASGGNGRGGSRVESGKGAGNGARIRRSAKTNGRGAQSNGGAGAPVSGYGPRTVRSAPGRQSAPRVQSAPTSDILFGAGVDDGKRPDRKRGSRSRRAS